MSFGFSPSDIVTLITLTRKVYNGWSGAGVEFTDISQTLSSFQILLEHVNRRFDAPGFVERQKELHNVLQGCEDAVAELEAVRLKYRKLRHRDRIALGLRDTRSPKDKLARHVGLLDVFLMTLEFDSLGKDVRTVRELIDRMPGVLRNVLPAAFGRVIDARTMDSRSAKSSVMTTYGDDDRQAYRELRRSLRDLGIGDSELRRQKHRLVEFVRSVVVEDSALLQDPATIPPRESLPARTVLPADVLRSTLDRPAGSENSSRSLGRFNEDPSVSPERPVAASYVSARLSRPTASEGVLKEIRESNIAVSTVEHTAGQMRDDFGPALGACGTVIPGSTSEEITSEQDREKQTKLPRSCAFTSTEALERSPGHETSHFMSAATDVSPPITPSDDKLLQEIKDHDHDTGGDTTSGEVSEDDDELDGNEGNQSSADQAPHEALNISASLNPVAQHLSQSLDTTKQHAPTPHAPITESFNPEHIKPSNYQAHVELEVYDDDLPPTGTRGIIDGPLLENLLQPNLDYKSDMHTEETPRVNPTGGANPIPSQTDRSVPFGGEAVSDDRLEESDASSSRRTSISDGSEAGSDRNRATIPGSNVAEDGFNSDSEDWQSVSAHQNLAHDWARFTAKLEKRRKRRDTLRKTRRLDTGATCGCDSCGSSDSEKDKTGTTKSERHLADRPLRLSTDEVSNAGAHCGCSRRHTPLGRDKQRDPGVRYQRQVPGPPEQLLLEYKELHPRRDGPLTVQLRLPSDTTVAVANDGYVYLETEAHGSSGPESDNYAVQTLPLSLVETNKIHQECSFCRHGFPSATAFQGPLDHKQVKRECRCKVLRWSLAMHEQNPLFLASLRRWVLKSQHVTYWPKEDAVVDGETGNLRENDTQDKTFVYNPTTKRSPPNIYSTMNTPTTVPENPNPFAYFGQSVPVPPFHDGGVSYGNDSFGYPVNPFGSNTLADSIWHEYMRGD